MNTISSTAIVLLSVCSSGLMCALFISKFRLSAEEHWCTSNIRMQSHKCKLAMSIHGLKSHFLEITIQLWKFLSPNKFIIERNIDFLESSCWGLIKHYNVVPRNQWNLVWQLQIHLDIVAPLTLLQWLCIFFFSQQWKNSHWLISY